MTDKINGRTPEEIKKGLWCCGNGDVSAHCGNCPYNRGTGDHGCIKELNADALAYIQQLEAARPKWISVEEPPKKWRENDDEQTLINYLVYSPDYGVDVGNWLKPAGVWVIMGLPVKVTHWMPLPEPPKEGAC